MEQPAKDPRPNRVFREYERLERNNRKRVAVERRLGGGSVLSKYDQLHREDEEERERKAARTHREEKTLEEWLAYDIEREVDSLRQSGDQWKSDIFEQWCDHLRWCRAHGVRTDPGSDVYRDLKEVERAYQLKFPDLD